MCGIAFILSAAADDTTEVFKALSDAVASRGPDSQDSLEVNTAVAGCPRKRLSFHASVLHLRGDAVTKQPFHANGNVLIYNGEIFDGLELSSHDNDGQRLFHELQSNKTLLQVFQKVEGPYAFVYYAAENDTLYWARDCLGRRSLMVSLPQNEDDRLMICSVIPSHPALHSRHWEEVDTSGIHACIASDTKQPLQVRRFARQYPGDSQADMDTLTYPFGKLNAYVPSQADLLQKAEDGLPIPSDTFRGTLDGFRFQLGSAVRKRVADIPRLRGPSFPSARVAVLFSGGLDCTVLAMLAHQSLHPDEAIDLLNVAFENPRSLANRSKQESDSAAIDPYSTPDRLAGRASHSELSRLCPSRQWNFVQVNVPFSEFQDHKQHIVDLMRPSNTAMDLSIVQALYFAARGHGIIEDEDGQARSYSSKARVLLSGLGADEQLGGYSRHKKAFAHWDSGVKKVEDWHRLLQELQMDLDRIGTRNLGRDDRIISSLRKEIRYPFLAGHVIAYLAKLPVHLKMDYSFGDGIGDKMLLRMLARELGLVCAAGFAKRAIQFGARSAKMELDGSDAKGDIVL